MAPPLLVQHLFEILGTSQDTAERRNILERLEATDLPHKSYETEFVLLVHCLVGDAANAPLYWSVLLRLLQQAPREQAVAMVHRVDCQLFTVALAHCCDDGQHAGNAEYQSMQRHLISLDISLSKNLLNLFGEYLRSGRVGQQVVALTLLVGWSNDHNLAVLRTQSSFIERILSMEHTVETLFPTFTLFGNLSYADPRYKHELGRTSRFLALVADALGRSDPSLERHVFDLLSIVATEPLVRVLICKYDKGALVRRICSEPSEPSMSVFSKLLARETVSLILKRCSKLTSQLALIVQNATDDEALVFAVAKVLCRLVHVAPIQSGVYNETLDALVALSTSTSAKLRFWGTKGLVGIMSTAAGRFLVARLPHVVSLLAKIVNYDHSLRIRALAMDGLVALARDSTNTKHLTQNALVLEALAASLTRKDHMRFKAVQGLISLASVGEAHYWQRMAKTMGLVEGLAEYGVSERTIDDRTKQEALQCVAKLIPFL